MVKGQLSLLKWIFPSRRKESFVEVYVLRYNIPSEDGKFFVERTLKDGRKIRIRIVPSSIRNRVKQLRFEFYEILKRHNVVKTELGRLVDPVEVPSLKMELEEWKNEFLGVRVSRVSRASLVVLILLSTRERWVRRGLGNDTGQSVGKVIGEGSGDTLSRRRN